MSKTPVVPDLFAEFSQFLPEAKRQAFNEKLANLGAVARPHATVKTTHRLMSGDVESGE